MIRRLLPGLMSVLTFTALCSCDDITKTLEADAHLDGSANKSLDKWLNHIWIVPNMLDVPSGMFIVAAKSDEGPVAAFCNVGEQVDNSYNTCSRGTIRAQKFGEELFVSVDDFENVYKVFQLTGNEKGNRIFFKGAFPHAAAEKIDEVRSLLAVKNKPKYAYGDPYILERASLPVSLELADAVTSLKSAPKTKPEIRKWLENNFRIVIGAEPKLSEVMKKANKFDKTLAEKYTQKKARFTVLPKHDKRFANIIAISLGRDIANPNRDEITTDRFLDLKLPPFSSNFPVDKTLFRAGTETYVASRDKDHVIFHHFRWHKNGAYTLTPLTPTIRASEYKTETMDESEIIEFLKKNQTNRYFFDEYEAETYKGFQENDEQQTEQQTEQH